MTKTPPYIKEDINGELILIFEALSNSFFYFQKQREKADREQALVKQILSEQEDANRDAIVDEYNILINTEEPEQHTLCLAAIRVADICLLMESSAYPSHCAIKDDNGHSYVGKGEFQEYSDLLYK